jgi:hypothetical protein
VRQLDFGFGNHDLEPIIFVVFLGWGSGLTLAGDFFLVEAAFDLLLEDGTGMVLSTAVLSMSTMVLAISSV